MYEKLNFSNCFVAFLLSLKIGHLNGCPSETPSPLRSQGIARLCRLNNNIVQSFESEVKIESSKTKVIR